MTAGRRPVASAAILLAAGLLASGLLAGCGKKSGLSPPPGEEASYSYPRDYPATLPGTKPRDLPPPGDENQPSDLSPFPDSRTSPTKSY